MAPSAAINTVGGCMSKSCWFKLSAPLLLLAIAGSAAAQNAGQLQLGPNEFPALGRAADSSRLVVFAAGLTGFPGSCSQLRAARLDELSARWQPVVEQVTLASCEKGMPVIGDSYLSYNVNARFKQGMVRLQGLPVEAYEESGGPMHRAQTYTVAAPLTTLLRTVGPVVQRDCLPLRQRNPEAVPTCNLQQEGDAWALMIGGVNRMVMLKPASGDPTRSQYVLSSSGSR